MKIDVFPPEGEIADIQRQIHDVLSTVLQGNPVDFNESEKVVLQEQIIEQLKPMARKVGGRTEGMMTPWVSLNFQPDEVQGHIDVSIRFYITGKLDPTGMQPGG